MEKIDLKNLIGSCVLEGGALVIRDLDMLELLSGLLQDDIILKEQSYLDDDELQILTDEKGLQAKVELSIEKLL